MDPYPVKVTCPIRMWTLTPTENITAYEFYRVSHPPMWAYGPGRGKVEKLQKRIDDWYNDLPENCKKYLTPLQQTCVEYCMYGE
jgi:hypothetical protein